MPKEFYTEKDIEDMVKRGILSLEVNDQVVLTELAYEKANKLGMKLVHGRPETPPSAPVRPYLSQNLPPAPAAVQPCTAPAPATDLHQRIRQAVTARLGSQIDPNLLDVIIKRVLNSTGVK